MAAPSAPTSVVLSIVNATIGVSWTAATIGADDPPIQSYTVTLYRNAAPIGTVGVPWVQLGAAVGAQNYGIAANDAMTATVTATNTDGTSPASTLSNSLNYNASPGHLPQVFDLWVAGMNQWYAAHGLASPPEMQFGAEYLKEHSSPNRVVWVPLGGPVGAPKDHSGTLPRHLFTRVSRVRLFCWGAPQVDTGDAARNAINNYGAAEQVLECAGAVMDELFKAGVKWVLDEWPPDNAALLALGSVGVLSVSFLFPVVAAVPPLATLTQIPLTPAVGS